MGESRLSGECVRVFSMVTGPEERWDVGRVMGSGGERESVWIEVVGKGGQEAADGSR